MRKRDGKKNVKIRAPRKAEEPFSREENVETATLTEEEVKEIIEKQENDQNQIDEAEQTVAKQKSKKKKIWNLIFFLINIAVVVGILVYQLLTQEVMPLSTLFNSGFNFWFLVLTLFIFALTMFTETFRTSILINHTSGKWRPFLSYKVSAVGRYYDVITPLATGGEPFQILYLKNRGLSVSSAISVPMGRYVLCQLASILMSTIVLILAATTDIVGGVNVISVAFYIGYAINTAICLVTIFLSISKKVGAKLVAWALKFLKKIKIVKNYDKQYNKVLKVVSDYQNTMQEFAKSKWKFVLLALISIIQYILQYAIPFGIVCLFLGWRPDLFLQVFIMGVMIEMAASFIPIPGGSGVSELSFTALFASLFTEGTLFWALILWRFMSYYIYIIQGIVIIMYDYFIGNKKYSWLKRKWELEAESAEFREQKLRNYQRSKNKLI